VNAKPKAQCVITLSADLATLSSEIDHDGHDCCNSGR
jgi:hypothetical protein